MLAFVTFLALQAAPAAAPQPERWSILVPVPDEPCRPTRKQDASAAGKESDVVVCGDPLPSQRTPVPEEAIPDGPRPSNPELRGANSLALEGTPCAARQGGCQVGFGPPIVPMVKGAVDVAKGLFKKHPDKSNRISIPLDDPAPPAANAAQ